MRRDRNLSACFFGFGLSLWVAVFPGCAAAGEVVHGLIRNTTGLPLVFPLQVHSAPGVDLLLSLEEAETGALALEAAIEGGRFFRVLAPPGQFAVQVRDRNNPGSIPLARIDPLEFRVAGLGTKGGYLIDLTRLAVDGAVTVRPFNLCQGYVLEETPRRQAPFDDVEGYGVRLPESGDVVGHPDARFDPERLTAQTRPARPTEYAPYLSPPRFGVRWRPC